MNQNIYPEATYEIWLCDDLGKRLSFLDNVVTVGYSKSDTGVGRATLEIPLSSVSMSQLTADNVVQIWRSIGVARTDLVFAGFIRGIELSELQNLDMVTLTVEDGKSLLRGRIVAYHAGSSESAKSGYLDDIMKEMVSENLGPDATDTNRDLSVSRFQIQADLSLGPSVDVRFAWRNVLEALEELFKLSLQRGDPVLFDVVPVIAPTQGLKWEFRTYKDQRGQDRTLGSYNPTVFSKDYGNLDDPRLGYDYSSEASYVYIGGQGEASDREVSELGDDTRIDLSAWNRRELFYDARSSETTAELDDLASQKLQEGRPLIRFTGSLLDTPTFRYGLEWNYGDKVQIMYADRTFEAWIHALSVQLNEKRQEKIQARTEVYL